MLNGIKEITSLIQRTIDNNFDIIFEKLRNLQQTHKYVSKDDQNVIETAFYNIRDAAANLKLIDSFTLNIYQTISGIVDKIH